MSANKKVIVVFGATGSQGGSVAKFLLGDGTFKVRAVTRKLDSASAKELTQQGAEVVEANLEDRTSIVKALTGAYGVFGVTNFWDPAVRFEGEVRQGKLLADVAKETGVQHFVWSSIEHSNVPHFESKAIIADYLKQIGVPVTILLTSFYFENFITIPASGLSKENGVYKFNNPIVPTATSPMYAVEDTGGWVLPVFLHPETYLGKDVHACSGNITMNEVAAVFEKVASKKATVTQIDRAGMEEYGKQGWFQQELILNLLYFVDHPDMRNVEESLKIFPQAQNFETFLRTHLSKFNL